MFCIGEHIIHPGQGVCRVTGIENTPAPMLLLEAKKGHAKTLMRYPLAQADRLHSCITREEAEHIMATYSEIACDTHTERNSSLEESYFKQQLKKGAPETVRVLKTMLQRIQDAHNHDKKPSSYYARILKEAHKRSVEELSIALHMSEEELMVQLDTLNATFIEPSNN
ncbi:hypothetical protein KPC83_03170 [Collinsella sp. zg1085]|uniref:CarD family transcriptional regulator n=1 Tax=Collinsella sp. zg1085 TaxID=2844380 RepID=UPI001C0DCB5A|nr:CarD family transcriptional regulator [Collinsella sp. zg1085]QWT18143.1 hypothetical protein KPC83_03170 [Collinsella sp. zg1085]